MIVARSRRKKIRNDFQKAHVVFIECFKIKCTDNEPTLIDVLVVFCDTKSRIKMSSARIYVIISIFLHFSVQFQWFDNRSSNSKDGLTSMTRILSLGKFELINFS